MVVVGAGGGVQRLQSASCSLATWRRPTQRYLSLMGQISHPPAWKPDQKNKNKTEKKNPFQSRKIKENSIHLLFKQTSRTHVGQAMLADNSQSPVLRYGAL